MTLNNRTILTGVGLLISLVFLFLAFRNTDLATVSAALSTRPPYRSICAML